MCFHWKRLLRIKNLFAALVCHSRFATNTVSQPTIFPSTTLGKITKICHFLFLAVCLDQLGCCSFCGDVCSECLHQKLLQCQDLFKNIFFWSNNWPLLLNQFAQHPCLKLCMSMLVCTILMVFRCHAISDPRLFLLLCNLQCYTPVSFA